MSSKGDQPLRPGQSRTSTAGLPASRNRSSVQPFRHVDAVALHAFASELENTARETQETRVERSKRLQIRESFLFKASVFSAVLAPILIVVGLILILIHIPAGGSVISAAGIIAGAGSAGLYRLRSQTVKELRYLDEQSDADLRLYQAIQVAALNPDPSRQADALAALASDVMRQNVNGRIEIEEERAL